MSLTKIEARQIIASPTTTSPRRRLLAWSVLKALRGQHLNQPRLLAQIRHSEGWGIKAPAQEIEHQQQAAYN